MVKETSDYSIFKSQIGNREVNLRHVNRLIEALKKRNLLHVYPILVNKSMEVIDGQHRLAAAMELKLPVFYVMENDLSLIDTMTVNSAGSSWTSRDFIESYAIRGNKHYIDLLRFMEDYRLSPAVAAKLLMGRNTNNGLGGTAYDTIKRGAFKVNSPHTAQVIAKQVNQLERFTDFSSRADPVLINTLWELAHNKQFDFDVFLYRLGTSGSTLRKTRRVRDYLLQIEDVYNYKVRDENRVALYSGKD